MGVMKKLYCDGNFVCDYESTGDDLKDAEICTAILKDRGLHREVTLEQSIFRQAYAFGRLASEIHKRDLSRSPHNPAGAVTFIVNAAFAIELYLKTIGRLNGLEIRGHDLLELFDALPTVAHVAMTNALPNCKWNPGVSDLSGLRDILSDIRKAYNEWRYLHESDSKAGKIITIQPMIFAMEVMHETCRADERIK